MKQFKGKAIYNPSGKAQEYSYWAVNFYNGCSSDCEYCYCKQYPMSAVWSNKPTIKKTLKDEETAISIFYKEMTKSRAELQKHGLFFNFSSDPFLSETKDLNIEAIDLCLINKIPVKTLTKQADWISHFIDDYYKGVEKEISFGFTLTGHDELEPGAATNHERIDAMKKLHDAGFYVWASIEPIIDLKSSAKMIRETKEFCDLYKIGLQSGKKYEAKELNWFVNFTNQHIGESAKIYWKDSLLKQAGIERKDLPDNCVDRGFNIFINN